MSTIGVTTGITLATKAGRQKMFDFYKGLSVDSVTMKSPFVVAPEDTETFDISGSEFVMVIGDGKTFEQESLNIELVDSGDRSVQIKNTSFVMLNASNLSKISITNILGEDATIHVFF